MIDGMWSGISGAIDSLKSKISSGISGIADKVRSVLGIHSPSTVFADIGWNMDEGMGVGFQNVMKQVRRDMENAIPMDFEVNAGWNARGGAQSNPNAATAPVQASGSMVINQSIMVTAPKALSEKELSRSSTNWAGSLCWSIKGGGMETTFINADGVSMTFHQAPPFFLSKLEGTGAIQNKNNTFAAPDQDGTFFVGATRDMRHITLEGTIVAANADEAYSHRRTLLRLFTPKQQGALVFRDRRIS
jgi:hypothetical protein